PLDPRGLCSRGRFGGRTQVACCAIASTPTGRCAPGLPTKILQHPCDWPLAHQRRSAGRSHIPRGEEGFTPSRYHAVEAEARLNVSKWQDEKAERNRRARTRLTKALPHIFPSAVLSGAA